MARRTWTDWDLVIAVAESRSIAGVCRRIGIVPRGGNYQTVNAHIKRLGINTDHFTGQAWNRGMKITTNPGRPLREILTLGKHHSTDNLRRRLLREGLLEPRCAICGFTTWNGQAIPLELDHVNGQRDDNRLENLRLVCPNCHAQTQNYRGRNIGRRS